ncbi:hypothetical protein [Nonomuraea sediminis]|uniref:hypothetical protein n=1 Tax=Nonomuraea sediminis TaxID=2835864 RepID=UPI001BDD4985|nr:hypothetical protein [Nonomuraea sediminis]
MGNSGLLLVSLAWLILLSIGLLVVRRELAILADRVAATGSAPADGIAIGSPAPRFAGLRPDDVVLFFFGDCAPCHEMAQEVGRSGEAAEYACVVSDGTVPDSGAGVAGMLPAQARVLTGASAADVRGRYRVHSGPFGVAVSGGLVVAKGILRHPGDLEDLRRMAQGVRA